MMMTKLLFLGSTLTIFAYGESATIDQDMDGVPDHIDQCLNTPFLNEVDHNGCSTSLLLSERKQRNDGLDISLGYGYSNNEDLLSRESQHTTKLQIHYMYDNWSTSLKTGYLNSDTDNGILDTTLKIKRKFQISSSVKVGFGIGFKFPTYDFVGNKTDYTLYGSTVYYPSSDVSLFAGVNHTFINDEEIITPLQDINAYYVGSGYFLNKSLYANLAYAYTESKFTTNQPDKSIMSTILYKINKKWFTSLSYSYQIGNTLNNSLSVKFDYTVW